MKKIYICGNPLLKEDSLPLKIIPKLKKILPEFEFIYFDPNENLKPENKEITIIDTVINCDRIMVIKDFKMLETQDLYSAHDLDLGCNLLLLNKIGLLDRMLIFGIPPDMDEKKVVDELEKIIPEEIKKTRA